ncbi:hypothetical protein D6745_04950 [Candidatus Woesearchaeota archaeon]|nr:MAG: hypothetical protein D6745_04950 [Candidatus Woesearchaeota archaeon]
MKLLLIDAKYKKRIRLSRKALDLLKKFRVVALYASVQFSSKIQLVVEQLEKQGIKVVSSRPARTKEKYQILGCDCFSGNLKMKETPDAFLYIGDGMFHPLALVLQQKESSVFKPVVVFDPISKKSSVLARRNVEKILRKYKASLMKFISKETVGILITTKPGQQQYSAALSLKRKYPNKNFYYFLDNNINYSSFDNFPFIDVWVSTACPRIAFDDSLHIKKPIINLNDALRAEDVLSRLRIN